MQANKDELGDAATKLKEKAPMPMNSMLEKQPRVEAVKKRADRSKMVAKDVPPTTPGTFLQLQFHNNLLHLTALPRTLVLLCHVQPNPEGGSPQIFGWGCATGTLRLLY